jgi:hypothetical protein
LIALVNICGVTWKIRRIRQQQTRDKNYFGKLSALQERANNTKRVLSLHFPWLTRVRHFIQGDAGPFDQRASEVSYVTKTNNLDSCTYSVLISLLYIIIDPQQTRFWPTCTWPPRRNITSGIMYCRVYVKSLNTPFVLLVHISKKLSPVW